MGLKSNETREHILKSAGIEFMKHGFSNASLRTIVSGAGVTTGAFYRQFRDKADLFDAVVSPNFHEFIGILKESAELSFQTFHSSPQNIEWPLSEQNFQHMISYIYDNLDAFKLLLLASEKTAYENFTNRVVDMEAEIIKDYLNIAKEQGSAIQDCSDEELHLFVKAQFSTLFELVLYNVPRDQAEEITKSIYRFFAAGWRALFFLDTDDVSHNPDPKPYETWELF